MRGKLLFLPREIWLHVETESIGIDNPFSDERLNSQKSADVIVCAGQRTNQEGSSPSGAQMRGTISEGGGNASLGPVASRTGQGVHREVESEGHEEKYRAVIKGEIPDEPVGQRWGKVEPALWRRKRFSFTHHTKVCADGTVRKICE